MISYADVFSQVSRMAMPDSNTEDNMSYFCRSAIATISEKVKPDADTSDIRLVMAAAALAYCRYIQAANIEDAEITSMKAGDVTVSKNAGDTLAAAQKFADNAIMDAQELFTDTSFAFAVI